MKTLKTLSIVSVALLVMLSTGLGIVSASTPVPPVSTYNPLTDLYPLPTTIFLPKEKPNLMTIYVISISSALGFQDVKAYQLYDDRTNQIRLPRDFNLLDFKIKSGDAVQWNNVGSYYCNLYQYNCAVTLEITGTTQYQTYLPMGQGVSYTFAQTGTNNVSVWGMYPTLMQWTQTITVGKRR